MKVGIFSAIPVCRNCALWLLAVITLGCSESNEARRQKFLERGNMSAAQSNGDEAIYYFEQALIIDSCYADALNNIGTVHFNTRRLEEALHFYDKALACDPGFINSLFNRYNTKLLMHNYDGALEDIGTILSIKPDTGIAYFSRGLAYVEVRRYQEAIESFEEAGKLDSLLRFDGMVNIASVRIRMRDYDAAVAGLEACKKIKPDEPNIHNSLGLIAVERGDFDEALVHANAALRLAPNHAYFLNNRGYIYLNRNEFELALTDIDRSIVLDPYNGWAYRNKGILYFMKGDLAQAERLLEHAQSVNSNIDLLHFYLAVTYGNLGKQLEACRQLRLSNEMGDNRFTAIDTRQCDGIE